jgi:hypothetical protein
MYSSVGQQLSQYFELSQETYSFRFFFISKRLEKETQQISVVISKYH